MPVPDAVSACNDVPAIFSGVAQCRFSWRSSLALSRQKHRVHGQFNGLSPREVTPFREESSVRWEHRRATTSWLYCHP